MGNTGPSRVSATRALSLRCEIPASPPGPAIYYLQRPEESACEKMKGRRTVSEDGSKAAAKLRFRRGEKGVFMSSLFSSFIRRKDILMPLSGLLCFEEGWARRWWTEAWMLRIRRCRFSKRWDNVWISPVEKHFNKQECTQLIQVLFPQLILGVKYLDSIAVVFVDFLMEGWSLPSRILVWLSDTYETLFNQWNSLRGEDGRGVIG